MMDDNEGNVVEDGDDYIGVDKIEDVATDNCPI